LVAELPLTSSSKVDERRLLKEAGLSSPQTNPVVKGTSR
jgi:D-alanine--poly(phosphoribitol) ligase subunit 1